MSTPGRFSTFPGLVLVALAGLLAPSVRAASPDLGNILPRGGQRGTEVDVTLQGKRLADAEEILYYSSGIRTVSLEAENATTVRARLKIEPDCPPGAHALRLRTRGGVSDLRTFFVGALPAVEEREPNSDFAAPQEIPLDVTVAGVVDNEDVDHYVFEAKKGQRISAEIEALRLGETIFDPYIAILDAARFELASCDDSALLRQDGHCQVIIPADGRYIVQVRESAYGGNGNCRYRLHVGTFPRPSAVYPAGGRRNEEVEVSFIGDLRGEIRSTIRATDGLSGLLAEDGGQVAPSPNPFRVVEFGNVLEVEPNPDQERATPGVAPCAFNGIIAEPGDVDYFRFAAEKGQVLDVELWARRLRSPLDGVLRIRQVGGGQIAANDDSRGPDSYIRFTASEAKEYTISVEDHLAQGGSSYVYRVEVTPVSPALSLTIPPVRRNSQERQSIAVPRGNRFAVLLSASRQDLGGDLALAAEGLPTGVSLRCEAMPANLNQIPVLFEATADAPLAGTLGEIIGRHADPARAIQGDFELDVDLLVGNPGNSVYLSHHVDRLAVVVTEEAPFRLRIVEPKVPLVQNGSMALRVVAERAEGFKAPIRLVVPWNPPGVSSQGGVKIEEGANEATLALNARGNAQVNDWKFVVNGVANAGSGPVWVASQLASLRVARPYVTLELQKGAAEQGQETRLLCKVNRQEEFAGSARIRLVGLPHKVTAPELEAGPETSEVVFPVTIAPDSPAGRHKNIFCRVEIVEHDEPIVHSTGGTELRIDKPLPAPKEKPKAVAGRKPEPEKKPAAEPERPLSRLEKLRLEYEARKKGAGTSGE